ncbi:MAG: hypothetical protein WD336_06435 [Trueperaceae bacterium]
MPLIRTDEHRAFLDAGPFPRALHVGDRQAVMLLCLQRGQELAAPDGDRAETAFVVLEGEGFVIEGEARHAVARGDVVTVAPASKKSLVAGPGTFVVLGVRSLAGRSS